MAEGPSFCYCPKVTTLTKDKTGAAYGSTTDQDKLIVIRALLTVAQDYGLSLDQTKLFLTIVGSESGFNLFASSGKASGLGQLTPGTMDDIFRNNGTARLGGFDLGFSKDQYDPSNYMQNAKLALASYLWHRGKADINGWITSADDVSLYGLYRAYNPNAFDRTKETLTWWNNSANIKAGLDQFDKIIKNSGPGIFPWEIVNENRMGRNRRRLSGLGPQPKRPDRRRQRRSSLAAMWVMLAKSCQERFLLKKAEAPDTLHLKFVVIVALY